MRTFKIHTLGCKVNQYDSQAIRESFLKAGFKELRNGSPADIYIVNTCTVTHKADRDSLYYVKRSRRQNPKAKIIVTGCLTKLDANKIKNIDKRICLKLPNFKAPKLITYFEGRTRAFLKVQDGCNNACSYCKVPLVRGKSRSRAPEEIVHEAKELAYNGYKEIVLTGICLGSFGKDLTPQRSIADIIKELEKIDGILRIRLSSIEAGDVSDELIAQIKESKKLCPHLHIPMQSGDDEILKKMKRRYSRKDYLCLIKKVKKQIPDIALTTDILVGFPGEKEANFENSIDLIKKIVPLKVHIFPYSPREGTAAHKFNGRVSPEIIRDRAGLLKAAADSCALDYKKRFSGRDMDVLIEGRCKEKKGYWEGFSGNYIKGMIRSNRDLRNKIIRKRFP